MTLFNKKPAGADPLEAAKIVAPPAAQPAPSPAKVAASPIPPPAPSPVAGAPGRYRVTRNTTVSLFGQLILLHADDIVSAEGYGPQGLQRILDSNVPVEKLP